MCSNSGDDTSNDDVFSEDSSESDNDRDLKAKRPLFYVNDEPNDGDIIVKVEGVGGAAPVNDMIFYNSSAIAMAGFVDDLESLMGNAGSNNNNKYNNNNNNDVITTEKKKVETESEEIKAKLEEDLINRNTLTATTTNGKKNSTDRVRRADRLTIDVNGDVIDNRSGIYLGNSNSEHLSLLTSTDDVVAKEDNAPPIVVEMWDETEEVRSPTLKSSESIRLPSTSRQASLLVDREERESTPFFFGGSPKDDRCYLEISGKTFDSSTEGQVRIEREPTPFFDEKTKEAKSAGAFLMAPAATETKFEREPTPFYMHDVTGPVLSAANGQGPCEKISKEAADSSKLTQNELPVTPPRKSDREPFKIKKDVANDSSAIKNQIDIHQRIELDRKCIARDESSNYSGDIVIVNNNCALEELQKLPLFADISEDHKKSTIVENGTSRSSGRRSRSETKVTKVATVEAPAQRALSVPRDTSPTIARGQSGESGRRKALSVSPPGSSPTAKSSAMSVSASKSKTTRVSGSPSVRVSPGSAGTLLNTGKTQTVAQTKDIAASLTASEKSKKSAKAAAGKTAGPAVSTTSSAKIFNADSAKSEEGSKSLNTSTQQILSITSKPQSSNGEVTKPRQSSRISVPQLRAKSSTGEVTKAKDSANVSVKQGRKEDDPSQKGHNSSKQCQKGDDALAGRLTDTEPRKQSPSLESTQQNESLTVETTARVTTADVAPPKTKLKLVSRFKKTMKGLLPNTPSDSTTTANQTSSTELPSTSNRTQVKSLSGDRKVSKTKTSDRRTPDSGATSAELDSSFSATPSSNPTQTFDAHNLTSDSTHANPGAVNEMSTPRLKESKPRSLLFSFLSSFHKPRSRSDKKSTSDRDGSKGHLFSKDRRTSEPPRSRDAPESPPIPQQPPDGARNLRPFSEKSLSRYSPFGARTTEGLCFLLLMTLFCLYMDMGVEKFVCYVLATFYTFCVLRLIGLID